VHNIFIYGDSVTWGIIPETRNRFSFDERWPGVLENQLRDSGSVGRQQFFETGNTHGDEFPGQLDLRRATGTEDEIAHFIRSAQHFSQNGYEI